MKGQNYDVIGQNDMMNSIKTLKVEVKRFRFTYEVEMMRLKLNNCQNCEAFKVTIIREILGLKFTFWGLQFKLIRF